MIYLRNLAFYAAFYGGSTIYVIAAVVVSYLGLVKPLRSICDGWGRWHRRCLWLLGIQVVETGQRPEGLALYAIKHEAFAEAIEMPVIFDYPAGLAKAELFTIPGWGRAARIYGIIEVRREAGASALRSMMKEAKAALAQGRPIVIFPEGTRVPHGTRAPLQSGFAALYKMLKLPVVPVAVDSGPLYHRTWKQPGTITVHFGEPIAPGLPREEIEARVLDAINCLNSD
tara:strand:+ start:1325 stop:2008 length:684 start_codon:yes stop_codon:yes gene_type:complete